MLSLLWLIDTIIGIAYVVLIAWVVLSWLVAFNVVNMRNQFVYVLHDALNRLTAPLLRPIRRIMPNLGGIDLSPLVLILALFFVRRLLYEYWPVSV